jgi:hypothetical protein
MRRILSFALYAAMIFGGLGMLTGFLSVGGKGLIFVAAGFLTIFGAYLMWIDFISPRKRV